MSIEALLERVAVGLERVADNQERLIAGQAAAIEKIEQPKAKRETKAEKEAREKAEAAAATPTSAGEVGAKMIQDAQEGKSEPAATASGDTAAASVASDGPTDEQLKATAVAWVGTTEDADEKKKRAEWLQSIARHLIGETDTSKMIMLTGEKSPLDAGMRKKAVFFIKRAHKLKGTQHVDFSAPYDFDEAPDQDAPRVETAAAEPEFDPLG